MPARGGAQAPSEISLPGREDKQHDCPFELPASLPNTYLGLCHELAERLTAAGNYLGTVQRLLEIGYRRGQPSPAELLEKAGSQITSAGEALQQLRRGLTGSLREWKPGHSGKPPK
jgi:hypothetical protein